MDRFCCAFVWASLSVLLVINVTNGQTVTIREINPTHSNVGGMNATGGRVNHLGRATNSIFYAASEFGGLFKSTDAGRTWVRLDTHLPTRVFDVKASPADPNLVIATSVYDGRVTSLAGINVSRDGGATWTRPASVNPPSSFCASNTNFLEPSAFGIAFDPQTPAHIFVGTNCGLARSTDGGLNWTFVNPGPNSGATNVFGVVVHHAGIIDTCGFGGHRRSTDGGNNWAGPVTGGTPLPASINCSITASPDESSVLFATAGSFIFETDNGGGSWTTQFQNPSRSGRIPFVLTHNREGRNFDLWAGDKDILRANCITPVTPGPGARCPAADTWTRVGLGAHSDMGEVAFAVPTNTTACRQNCTSTRTTCNTDCDEDFNSCIAEGHLLRSQCLTNQSQCKAVCTKNFNACNANCSPDGCPVLLASDGGTYINTVTVQPNCQVPKWVQSDVTTRGLWLWSLNGGNIPNSLVKEGLYMGAQDDGAFATLDAGAVVPNWINPDCCDAFDTVSDSTQVLYTDCCFGAPRGNRVFRRGPGMVGGAEIPNYPDGLVPGFSFPDVIARFGTNRFAMITDKGIFSTQNIAAIPIVWTSLGVNAPTSACGLWAAGPQSSPTFFALTGCSGNSSGTLRRFNGTSTTSSWQLVNLPPGAFGVGVFAVDPNNPTRLFVSAFNSSGVHMFRSSDGGANWVADTVLDALMTGGGLFRMQNSSYAQPTLVAFDPNDANTLLAAAADAGIFLSRNNGVSWVTVTNNSGDVSNPIVPRSRSAYFNRECSQFNIYVGTQGRGAWHLSYRDPAGSTVTACQSRCDATETQCEADCEDIRKSCLSEGGLASTCNTAASQCRTKCTNTQNTCRQNCVTCPQ
jgi:hypothetical protein